MFVFQTTFKDAITGKHTLGSSVSEEDVKKLRKDGVVKLDAGLVASVMHGSLAILRLREALDGGKAATMDGFKNAVKEANSDAGLNALGIKFVVNEEKLKQLYSK